MKNSFNHRARLSTHIKKHYKKYIFGSIGYGVLHFLFAQITFIKIFTMFFIWGISINNNFFGYSKNLDYLSGLELIQQKTQNITKSNFTKIISEIESGLGLENGSIFDFDYQQNILNLLKTNCSKNSTVQGEKVFSGSKSQIDKILIGQSDKEKLITLKKLFEVYTKSNSEISKSDEKKYCQQKYVNYKLLGYLQNIFTNLTKKNDLFGITDSSAKNKNDILISNLEDKILGIKKSLVAIQNSDIPLRLLDVGSGNDYQFLKQRIQVVADYYIQHTFQELTKRNILTIEDVQMIKNSLEIHYNDGCTTTKGSYSVAQKIDSEGKVIPIRVEKTILNINICTNYEFIDNLQYYVKSILVHEIGHHVYYFKDTTKEKFEQICRKNGKQTCKKEAFISKYSMQSAQEDYAETFLNWFLGNTSSNSQNLTKKFTYFYVLFTL